MDCDGPTSYLATMLEVRPVNGGRGVFARRRIQAGALLAVWGGEVVPEHSFSQLPAELQRISVQIEDSFYLAPSHVGSAEWINHSCNPNAGMSGQIALVALRDIEAGEEVCYDYAMSDGSAYDEFVCRCGAPNCRGRVTGDDWRLSELWERYDGYFSPYLQRRIEQLRKAEATHLRLVEPAVTKRVVRRAR